VAAGLGTGTYVDLMAQYHPAGLVGTNQRDDYHQINRQLARGEYELAAQYASELGLTRLDERSRASSLQLPAAPAPAGT
jgi:putative pyruvate formate lyase activating enzyme